MLSIGSTTKIYVATDAVDMRKAFDTLAAIVANVLEEDPLSGHLFVFSNRARNRLKILVWEPGGFWLLARRLEKGTFAWPTNAAKSIELTAAQLGALLGGLDLRDTKEREWYRKTPKRSPRKRVLASACDA